MAIVNIYDTPFSTTPKIIELDKKQTIEDVITDYTNTIAGNEELCECYDLDTGETFFASVETEGYKVVTIANDKEVPLNYSIIETDIINVILIPKKKGGAGINSVLEFIGAAAVIVGVGMLTFGWGSVVAAGLIIMGGLGLQLYAAWAMTDKAKESKTGDSLNHESNLSISGCGNQDITDKVFPVVLGKHLVNPYIVGSPYCTTLTKDFRGDDGGQYVTALYCIGYAPLKLTDFRIDQTYLAYNRNTNLIAGISTVMHGLLKGVSGSSVDNGDILKKWKNNDVSIEILQAGDKCDTDEARYGTIFPQTVEQLEVNANLINIKDSLIQTLGNKIYKGTSVPDGFMTNSVRFSRSCPQRLEVEIDFLNGLYAQRGYKNNIFYYNLPVRLAVQWRFIKKGQESSNALSPTGWSNFEYIELTPNANNLSEKVKIPPKIYTYEKKLFDYQSSRGQSTFSDTTGNLIPTGTNGYFNYNNRSDLQNFIDNDLWLNSSSLFEFGTESQETVINSNSTNSEIKEITEWYVKAFRWKAVNTQKTEISSKERWFKVSETVKNHILAWNYKIAPSSIADRNHGGLRPNYTNCLVIYRGNLIVPDYRFCAKDTETNEGTYWIAEREFTNEYDSDFYVITQEFSSRTIVEAPHHNHAITNFPISTQVFKAKYGVNERRYVIVKEFTDEECRKMIGYQTDEKGEKYADIDSVEVRVLRITPSYLDETGDKDSDSYQNMSYQDLSKWTYLRTFSFDKKEYKNALDNYIQAHPGTSVNNIPEGAVPVKNYPLRPLSKEDMDKFCIVALTLKQDVAETGGKTLKKLDLIAESFAPNYDKAEDKWFPKNINKKFKYYKIEKEHNEVDILTNKISYFANKGDYLAALENGINVGITDNGNDFIDQLKNEIFGEYVVKSKNYYLSEEIEKKYITRNAASISLLTLLGKHLGKKAKTYDDINMESFKDFYNFCEDVTDGSYESNSKNLKHYKFECNGVISQEIKFETLFQKILLTGRASYRRDDENKYEVVIGKKGIYPTLMINQQNCIAYSNSRDFTDKPSGFHCQFIDETDNYTTNDIYVMMDGEDYRNPTREIEELQIPYVTGREQLWSLARANLGAKVLQREIYTRTVGKIGYTVSYGDIVLLQDATLLVGNDNGGRIREIIQDEKCIYGFTVNEPFIYKGLETTVGSGLCTQGVTILQPQKTGGSRCVTLRLAMPDKVVEVYSKPEDSETRTKLQTKSLQVKSEIKPTGWGQASDELHNTIHTYQMKKGLTNLVLLENPISRQTLESKDCPPIDTDDENYITVNVIPKYDNIVAFGDMGFITIKAMVINKKPQEGEKFQLTLMPYDDSLYEMGGVIPEFNARMTQPSEESGTIFEGAVSKDDVITTALSTAQSSINNIEKIVSNLTSLYSLDISPEYQSVPITPSGTLISQTSVYIKAQFYYNGKELIPSQMQEDESLTFKAFYKNSEVGTWLIGDDFREEILNQFGVYDNFPVVKISAAKFLDNDSIITIYAEHKKGESVNVKTKTASVSKINYGDSLVFYDMSFPYGAGSIKRSVERNENGKYDYLPKKITAEKRIIKMEDGTPAYQPTEYGTIDVKFYDNEGNLINSELNPEDNTSIGDHKIVNDSDEFDSEEEYFGKFEPFILKLEKEYDGEVAVLGFGFGDTGVQDDTAVVFYQRS